MTPSRQSDPSRSQVRRVYRRTRVIDMTSLGIAAATAGDRILEDYGDGARWLACAREEIRACHASSAHTRSPCKPSRQSASSREDARMRSFNSEGGSVRRTVAFFIASPATEVFSSVLHPSRIGACRGHTRL
jgi:hypothetical protein